MAGRLIAVSKINIYLKSDPTILMALKSSKLSFGISKEKVTHPFEDMHIDLNSVYFLYIGPKG